MRPVWFSRLGKVAVGVFLASAAPALGGCETYALHLFGNHHEAYIGHDDAAPLLRFATHRPWWNPYRSRTSAEPSSPLVEWEALPAMARLERVGSVDGHRIYAAHYYPLVMAVLWEDSAWSFCPALLLEGDPTIVARVGEPQIFRWQGRAVLSVRVYFQGMGSLQQSLFFAMVDGRLVHLRPDSFSPATDGFGIHHRGGGFCRDSLNWQNIGWRQVDGAGGTLRVKHRIDGNRLRIEGVEVDAWERSDCGQYDEIRDWKRRRRRRP